MKLFATILLAVPATLLAQTTAPKPAEPAYSPAVAPDKVVIAVGDLKVTAAQFNLLIDMLPEQNRAAARGAGRREFADELVRVLALVEEGKKRKLDQTLAYKTQAEFQAENLLAGRAYAEISKVDDADLHQYYDTHKEEFEQVRARHILIRAKGSPMPAEPGKKELTDEEALAKAQEVRKKIVDGTDFAVLAAQESDDSGSKGKGGELDPFKHGEMVAPFDAAAFNMKAGDLSEPVKSAFGYHIIKVEAHETEPFESAKADILRKLQPQKAKDVLDDLVKKTPVTLDPEFFGPVPK